MSRQFLLPSHSVLSPIHVSHPSYYLIVTLKLTDGTEPSPRITRLAALFIGHVQTVSLAITQCFITDTRITPLLLPYCHTQTDWWDRTFPQDNAAGSSVHRTCPDSFSSHRTVFYYWYSAHSHTGTGLPHICDTLKYMNVKRLMHVFMYDCKVNFTRTKDRNTVCYETNGKIIFPLFRQQTIFSPLTRTSHSNVACET